MKTSIAYRIRKARENKGFDQRTLSEKLDIATRTLQRWEKGEQVPNSSYLLRIAKYTGVRPEWLLTGEGEMVYNILPFHQKNLNYGVSFRNKVDLIKIPLFSSIPAGKTSAIFHPDHAEQYVVVDNVNDPDAFALIVKGNSMAPKIENGDIVVISPHSEVRNGDICVIRINEEDVLKKIKIENEHIHLIPLNPSFEPLTVRKRDVACIWKVVKVIKSL